MLHTLTASDGETLHYAALGRGRPVVFLHGWTSSHAEWLPFAQALGDGFRCYCWDARAHGGHALRTATAPSLARMAEDLQDLLVDLEMDDAALLGHSMGALTIWEYVRRFGCERLRALVLIDQSPRLMTDADWPHGVYGDFSHDANAAFIEHLERDFADAVLRLAADGLNARAKAAYARRSRGVERAREYLQALDPEPLIAIWKSLSAADYRDVLPRIDVPTMLVHGDASHFYTVELARHVRARIPDAELHVYEGTDHSPHQWQRERFVADLRAFLDRAH